MKFYVGQFRRSDSADYDMFEDTMMREQLGEQLIDDMLAYSARAWKTYGEANDFVPSALYVHVWCEFSSDKHATWFSMKYPQIKTVNSDFKQSNTG